MALDPFLSDDGGATVNWRLDCWKSNGDLQCSVPLGIQHTNSNQYFCVQTEVLENSDVIVIIPTMGVVKRWDKNFEHCTEFHIGKSPQGDRITNLVVKGKHLLFLRDKKIEVWNLSSHKQDEILQYPELEQKEIKRFHLSNNKQQISIITSGKVKTYNPMLPANNDEFQILNIKTGALLQRIYISDFPKRIKKAEFLSDGRMMLHIKQSNVFDEKYYPIDSPEDAKTPVCFLTPKKVSLPANKSNY